MTGSARISACGKYRYELWRCWDDVVEPACPVAPWNLDA